MGKDEIEKLIEIEKQQIKDYLKLAERFHLPDEAIEKQVNFYLEKISELLKQIS